MTIISTPWWKNATIYQIWPASYKDSNGDGFGDLQGIIDSLDYVQSIGVDVIWLSPHYDLPQDDMGYDISDYNKIYPKYGDMATMDALIEGVHQRGMKLILDLVINHTSSEHAWFQESRKLKDNPKRDWYIWKKPRFDSDGNRHPPNNWVSHFSGSAWEYDETTEEYYLRLFALSQPDLNWENDECRAEIYKVAVKYWLDKGIDGFRIDTAGLYLKTQLFEDAPITLPGQEFQPCPNLTNNGPRIHEFHKEMYSKVTSHYDAMTVGEVGHCLREEALKYVSASEHEMNMMFLFDVVDVGSNKSDRFKYDGFNLPQFKQAVINQSDFTRGTDAWLTTFIENHDQPRSVSRFGDLKWWKELAKLLAMLQTTLSGTLFVYQGQEIGMTNLPADWDVSEYLDINTINYWHEFLKKNPSEEEKKELMKVINLVARDHSRSPVQWNASRHGGFTSGKPWMRVNENYKDINVESQINDPDSVLNFWRKSLGVRRKHRDLLVHGTLEVLDFENEKVFTYLKTLETTADKAYVVLNFSDEPQKLDNVKGTLINSNAEVKDDILLPYEGRVYIVS